MQLLITRVVKILLQIFSTIVLIYGIFLVVCGLLIVYDMRSFSSFIQSKTFWLPYLITFSGFMMVLLAIFGVWATQRQNYKLLVTFLISAAVVLLIEVAIVTWISANNPTYSKQLKEALESHVKNYTFTKPIPRPLDHLQRKLQCCGVKKPDDWNESFNNNLVPGSCCLPKPNKAGTTCPNTRNPANVYQQGCFPVLSKRIRDHWLVVSRLAVLAAFGQGTRLITATSIAQFAIDFISANTGGSTATTGPVENIVRVPKIKFLLCD